jgi:hypothetical protein
VNPNTTTTYSCTGTTAGVSSTANTSVVVNAAPHVSLSANPSILTVLGLSSTLTASGAATYQWSTGATGSTCIVVPLVTTTYSVIGTDVNGCTGSASATVSLNLLGGLGLTQTTQRTSADPTTTRVSEETQTNEEAAAEITQYPNPTRGVFYVKNVPKNSAVSVYNIIGEPIFSDQTESSMDVEIDLSTRPRGIYILKVQSKGQIVFWSKVVRE